MHNTVNNYLCLLIPSLELGGMERVMSSLANYFADVKEDNVILVLFGKNREVKYKLSEKVRVIKPDFFFDNSYRGYYTIKTMLWLRRTVKRINPITILSFGEYWNNMVLISLWGIHNPIYLSDRSSPSKRLGFPGDFLRERLYPRSSGIIYQTEVALELMNRRYRNNNKIVIGNPIRPINTRPNIKKENIVLSIGRLINTKNFDRLIRIFYKVDLPDWKLVIVGGDSNNQSNFKSLNNLVDNLGMRDRIFLDGYRSNIEDYLLRSKVFAFTSSSEGFPNVIGEAMCAGLPVISYNCVAGPSEMVVDGKTGYLIDLFNDNDFAIKLKYLMTNEDLRNEMGKESIISIKQFSLSNICETYYNFILQD